MWLVFFVVKSSCVDSAERGSGAPLAKGSGGTHTAARPRLTLNDPTPPDTAPAVSAGAPAAAPDSWRRLMLSGLAPGAAILPAYGNSFRAGLDKTGPAAFNFSTL